jgi:hypothetical protein
MAQPVRVRTLTEQEGQKLQRIVRRGSTSTVRFRRAMMLLASAGGNSVPVIARLAQADEDTVRERAPWRWSAPITRSILAGWKCSAERPPRDLMFVRPTPPGHSHHAEISAKSVDPDFLHHHAPGYEIPSPVRRRAH